MFRGLLALLGLVWPLTGVLAQADPAAAPDKNGFTLFNPTPAADLRSLCTDRPTKSNGPCTVDAGHWQVEADVYNYTSATADGITTTTQLFTNPTLKLGLTNTLDVEAGITPYERVTTRDKVSGVAATAGGVGDLYLRAKLNLLGDDGGDVGFALLPWIKLPTAPRTIGNGEAEGGVIAPIQLTLPMNWQLVIDPEVDALADTSGSGRHLNTAALLSVSYPATKTVSLSAEIWGDVNFDPIRTVTQASFDLGAAWIPAAAPSFQLDGGVNLGLNRATPGAQAYLGVSRRF
jgi:hypothetical protein